MLGIQPLLDCLKLSASTNDTKRVGLFVFWWGGNGLLILAMFVLVRAADLPIQCASLALVWLVSTLMWWYYDRAYRLGKFDVIASPSSRRG
jgi:hypothetical protein